MRIDLITGDLCNDGHGRYDTIAVESNVSAEFLKDAYHRGAQSLNLDIVADYCCEYEDRELPRHVYDKLVAFGFDPYEGDKEQEEEDIANGMDAYDFWTSIDSTQFAAIYLFIAQYGDPHVSAYIIQDTKIPTIEIGGYGFFS